MSRAVTRRLLAPIRNCVLLFCAAPLLACVSATTGGFDTSASRELAARDYLALANGYFEAGDLQAARHHLDNARKLDSGTAGIHHAAALIAAAGKDFELAEQNFELALRLDRNDSAMRNNFGVLLFSLGRAAAATEHFRAAAQDSQYQGRAWALENLGRALLRLQRWDDARDALENALLLNGDLALAALELSLLHKHDGNHDAARRAYRSYVNIAERKRLPHTPKALLAGAEIAWQSGNRREVEEFGLILGKLYPGTAEYRTYMEMIHGN